jgi:cbb3-type cytochrome oxidase subunit 1
MDSAVTTGSYNYKVVRQFAVMTIVWGIVGMLVGVIIAAQLLWPELNYGPWLSYGRLRPLHTNAVIFAFVGNMMFAGVYHSTQRLVKARLPSDLLAKAHFWGWQLIIVAAVLTPGPDVASQLLMAAPLLVLYVLSIGVAFLVARPAPGAQPAT